MTGKHHRKRRTRSHVIADISVNYVERLALLEGYTVERIQKDYGIDLSIATYSREGYIEHGTILVQLKATESERLQPGESSWSLPLDTSDLNLWLEEPFPMLLIYYHAKHKQARWLYIQRDLKGIRFTATQKSKTVQLPMDQRLNRSAMRRFREFKERVLEQVEGVITHD